MASADKSIVLAALICSACGGSGNTATVVNGTTDGRSFSAKDAISTQATGSGFSFGGPATYVEITDYASACAMETSHLQPTNGQRLVIGLASYDSSGHAAPPTTPGAFPVQQNSPGAANSNTAEVYYDAGCMKLDPHAGVAGLVQVTSIQQDGTLEGTFDFFLGCGGFSTCSGPAARVTGSFHAAVCSGFSVNSTPACG